jgi:hypothetical integral membrane protein (TIGR02206 family)
MIHPFVPFGPSHWTVLVLTAALTLTLVFGARRAGTGGESGRRAISWTLAAVLVVNLVADLVFALMHPVRWQDVLPMQLCDWVTLLCAAALVWRHRLAYELAYFWGLAGTLQAVFTPELGIDFPSFVFVTFMICHAGAVVAIFYLTFGLRLRPEPRSIVRAFLWIQVYLAAATAVNLLLDANYGFLRRKPAHASLFDLLGPWPWYLVSLEALALALFVLLYAPFAFADQRRKRRQAWQEGAA